MERIARHVPVYVDFQEALDTNSSKEYSRVFSTSYSSSLTLILKLRKVEDSTFALEISFRDTPKTKIEKYGWCVYIGGAFYEHDRRFVRSDGNPSDITPPIVNPASFIVDGVIVAVVDEYCPVKRPNLFNLKNYDLIIRCNDGQIRTHSYSWSHGSTIRNLIRHAERNEKGKKVIQLNTTYDILSLANRVIHGLTTKKFNYVVAKDLWTFLRENGFHQLNFDWMEVWLRENLNNNIVVDMAIFFREVRSLYSYCLDRIIDNNVEEHRLIDFANNHLQDHQDISDQVPGRINLIFIKMGKAAVYFLLFNVIMLFCGAFGTSSLSVTRSIDLTTQLARHVLNIEYKTDGTDTKSFLHVLSKADDEHLSYLVATDSTDRKLAVTKVPAPKDGNTDYIYYKIDLIDSATKDKPYKLRIEYVLTQILKPYPAQISQAEQQFMQYTGTVNYVSYYKIDSDTTNVKVGNGKVLSHSAGKASSEKIQVGPTTNVQPFTATPLTIHYENNSPFAVVTSLKRIIEVSHWGNIAIEDHVEVLHKGAELKGSFSRLEYQVDRRVKSPVVKVFKASLPIGARDIYYRDQIGNISTSNVRGLKNRIEVEMRPRFPLFGGWKTNYVLGYNVPSSDFLSSADSKFALKIPLIHPLFADMVIEKAEIQVVLPETATNVRIVKPYAVTHLPDTLYFSYLDTVGRPTINLVKENLVEWHSQSFTFYYDYSPSHLLREPLIAVIAFFLVFLVIIVFNRFDFSISRKQVPHLKVN
uniref:Dolichyl-diphosphooligosaccharide--protein glycosyltransferase subunit 1 n=1 Tax=Panagrolaimus sp. JU765 TaxID=591449 RepID=A0AC34QJB5_9BILA